MDGLHQLVPRALYMEPILPDGINAANLTAVAEYYVTHRIPQRFNPGIVVASIAVSALGSYSTLLVLGKRTSNKGKKNIFLLSLAATTMAAVGIWGMHFIGMHMSLRPVAGVNWYIKVDPGFTVLSLFVPIIALHAAFFIVDAAVSFSLIRTIISGILTGLVVCLMHYSASLKTNYAVSYSPTLVTISIVVACVAATVALTGFFKFRSQWEDSWWKRMLCAFVLAAAVSGMHYIGVWGTSYKVKASTISGMNEVSLLTGRQRNNVLVIAIGCMCFVIICFSIFIAVSDMLIVRDARRKSKKVVVCSATFDKQGRLLVKPDGTMPLMIIETDVNTRDILDALDNRQPTFQWLYSLSWDWAIITPWLRAITSRFAAENQNAQRNEAIWKSRGKKMIAQGRRSLDISEDRRKGPQSLADFRDRFIDSAYQLANELDIPFEEIGVLYDHVLPTGTRRNGSHHNSNVVPDKFTPSRQFADDESSINGPVPSIFGEGNDQEEGAMLFLVRELPNSAASTERFRQMGYRMTETRFLAGVLADRVAVQKEEMEPLLDSLKVYAKRGTRPVVQPGGVYCGLFGVRASTSKEGGLDVLVYNFARHQIPAYRLPDVQCITPEMKTFLGSLDQATMEDAMKVCERESIRSGERRKYLQSISSVNVADNHENEAEQEAVELMIQFQTALFIALDALHNSVRFYPKICQTARISAEVLEVPSSLDDSTAPAEMILVQAVLPEARTMPTSYSAASEGQHVVSEVVPTDKPSTATPFVFVPYTLFSKSQMMLLRGRQADDFEHEVILEMRRRYPSSLQSEAEEKALFEPPQRISHKDSFVSSAGRFTQKYAGSDDDDKLETASKFSDDNPTSPITNKVNLLPSAKRWGGGGRRGSGENGHEYDQAREATALSPARRQSVTSSRSRQTNEDHEMRQLNDGPLSRADSLSRKAAGASAAAASQGSAAGGNNMNSSLGIRRFIQGQQDSSASDGRFVHPVDDAITEEGHRDADLRSVSSIDVAEKETSYPPTSPYMPSSNVRTLTEASASAFGQSPSHRQQPTRPSTAPANVVRRELNFLRPSSSGTGTHNQRTAAPPSQRQRRNRTAVTNHDEGSLLARLQSDGWHTRQIQSLERSPAGTALLGVDF